MKQVLPLLALSVASLLAFGCKGGGDASTKPAMPAPVQPGPDGTPAAPTISDISPESGRPGDAILIRGTHFVGPLRVEIGGVAAAVVATRDGQVTVTVPDQARTGRVILHAKGGRVASRADFQVNPKPFDPLVDVVPFSFAQVEHWPGLVNTGGSCFLNTSIKLLAAIRELDPALADHPGDDAALAGVRRQLRLTINHIRLGDRRPAGAQDPMRALIDAFGHHPLLAKHVAGTQGDGGNDLLSLRDILKTLGLDGSFKIACRKKWMAEGKPPVYQNMPLGLVLSSNRRFSGFDPQGPQTLASYLDHVTRNPGDPGGGSSWFNYPVKVPDTALLTVLNMKPRRDLAFSTSVRIPVYQVDETLHEAKVLQEVTLRPVAVSILRGEGHVVAAILGPGGFYVNDDAKKPYLEEQFMNDDTPDRTQKLGTDLGVILLRREP